MRALLARLGGAYRWHRYYQVTRRKERLLVAVAHALPKKLKERVYIDVAVEALSKMDPHTIVPDVRMTEVLDVYWNGRVR